MRIRFGGMRGVLPRGYVPDNPDAYLTFDWTLGRFRLNGVSSRVFSSAAIAGLTTTRAHTNFTHAYAQTAAGLLVPFAANQPRYTDKGLLVEEARTNLLLRSQEFDSASWNKTDITVTANATAAPDGTTTAELLTEGSAGTSDLSQSVAGVTSATASIYVKRSSVTWMRFVLFNNGATANRGSAWFNLATGAKGTVSNGGTNTGTTATITPLANDWYRITLTTTFAASVTATLLLYSALSDNSTSRESGSAYYAWGAQLESGATFPTSYIPTTSASATRAADSISISNLSVGSGSTLYAEFVNDTSVTSGYAFQLDDGAETARALLTKTSGTAANIEIYDASGVRIFLAGVTLVSGVNKVALRLETNNMRAAVNGTLTALDTAGTVATMSRWAPRRPSGANAPNNYHRNHRIYTSRAFSDAELQAATQ